MADLVPYRGDPGIGVSENGAYYHYEYEYSAASEDPEIRQS
ncbi:MAG: hypothetical protein ABJC63_00040 [Gemmatimonadales bacterium]